MFRWICLAKCLIAFFLFRFNIWPHPGLQTTCNVQALFLGCFTLNPEKHLCHWRVIHGWFRGSLSAAEENLHVLFANIRLPRQIDLSDWENYSLAAFSFQLDRRSVVLKGRTVSFALPLVGGELCERRMTEVSDCFFCFFFFSFHCVHFPLLGWLSCIFYSFFYPKHFGIKRPAQFTVVFPCPSCSSGKRS